jgi:hypothetical protein
MFVEVFSAFWYSRDGCHQADERRQNSHLFLNGSDETEYEPKKTCKLLNTNCLSGYCSVVIIDSYFGTRKGGKERAKVPGATPGTPEHRST